MFRLHVKTENAAFDENPELELADILARTAADLRAGRHAEQGIDHPLRDSNGNKIGSYRWVREDRERRRL